MKPEIVWQGKPDTSVQALEGMGTVEWPWLGFELVVGRDGLVVARQIKEKNKLLHRYKIETSVLPGFYLFAAFLKGNVYSFDCCATCPATKIVQNTFPRFL